MNRERESIERLRAIPEFKEFAEDEMATDPDFWRSESREGDGFFRVVAEAVVVVGGGGAP